MDLKKSQLFTKLFRISLRFKTDWSTSIKYKAEIDPNRVIWIYPMVISFRNKAFVPVEPIHCQVHGGDWDLTERWFEDTGISNWLKEHFQYSIPWIETETY